MRRRLLSWQGGGLLLGGLLYALVLTGLLFGYQQHLIRHRDGGGCFRAFLNNNWVGLIIFAGIAASFTIGPDA